MSAPLASFHLCSKMHGFQTAQLLGLQAISVEIDLFTLALARGQFYLLRLHNSMCSTLGRMGDVKERVFGMFRE